MAAQTYTLTGNLATLLGTSEFADIEAYLVATEQRITDTTTGQVRLGSWKIDLEPDTTFTLPGLPSSASSAWTPGGHLFRVIVQYWDVATRRPATWASNYFRITANTTMGQVVESTPVVVDEAVVTDITAARDEAVAAASGAQAALESADAFDTRPTWARTSGGVAITGRFDPATGWFNLRSDNMTRWRKAKARMRTSATGRAEIAVIAPSTYASTDTQPASVYSTPARMKAMLRTLLGVGDGGTGMVVPWQTYNTAGDGAFTSPIEPRWSFKRAAADGYLKFGDPGATPANPAGIYQYGAVDIKDVGPQNNWAMFVPGVVGDLWAYFLETGTRTIVIEQTAAQQGTSSGTYKDVAASSVDTTTPTGNVPALAGYLRHATNGGQRVAKWTPAGTAAAFKFLGNGSTGFARLVAAEVKTAGGLSVHNLAMSGRALFNLFQNTSTDAGTGGPALVVGMARADVMVIAMELNDYKGGISLTTWYNQLTTLVQYQQAHGGPDGLGGDVVLVTNAQPDYTSADWSGKPTPLVDFYAAAYRVAMECDVPLFDEAYRWVSYAKSVPLFGVGDPVHPGLLGADDQGSDLARGLAAI